jgi:flagellin-specific chaperone FliS
MLWRSYRRFAIASRLEQPDAFTLRPTGPSSLIDRIEDLERLLNCVKRNRLVLLDGESGCGKSALVGAGLVPQLQTAGSLLPVVIRDWGEDWVRGPLSAVLDSLFQSVPQADRETLRRLSPDLAADTNTMAADLDARLKAVIATLGRRPLLIADQFDDYQALHRERFLDGEANWLSPAVLIKGNPFWQLVSAGLNEGRLHLLVVTRSDASAGLACIRFLGEDQTATRTLPRIDVEYLRPLLTSIAPDDARPAVISNPASGWYDLRDILERDLKAEGAILMQQVRTVLLGLRQLALLIPRAYRAAGGLRGVETLVISHSLRQAGDAAGGGEEGPRVARTLLRALILPGGPNQRAKAQRVPLPTLIEIAGSDTRANAILHVLQDEEVVRPAVAIGDVNAWQLDHDYLASAVLAEARQADRWSVILREGKAHYDDAAGNLRGQWSTLLPAWTLVRVCWERVRGRLAFADARHYAMISAIRPALFLLCLTLIGAVAYNRNRDRILNAEATRLVDQFGGSGQDGAVLSVWRAPNQVRQRVHDLVYSDRGRFERALRSRWLLADAGFEPDRLREAAATLRSQLQQEKEAETVKHLTQIYTKVALRLTNEADVKAEASALRTMLEQKRDFDDDVVAAYAGIVAELTDAADVRAEVIAVRAKLEQEQNIDSKYNLVRAYKAVATQLRDSADVKAESAALCSRLVREKNPQVDLSLLSDAYEAVGSRLTEADEVKSEAQALRVRLENEKDSAIAGSLAKAYSAVASRLADEAELKAEATALRVRLENEKDPMLASRLCICLRRASPAPHR